jgi:hypothetical protein
MPIQRRNTPTLTGVARQIEAFEARYRIDTVTFLQQEGRIAEIDSEDGVEWLYLAEQLRALQEAAVEDLYSSHCETVLLQNDECCPELLAA